MNYSTAVIFNYQKIGKYALNVLSGALEQDVRLRNITVQFAKSREQLVLQLNAASRNFDRVNLDAIEELLATMRETLGPKRNIYFGSFPSEVRPEHLNETVLRILKRYIDNDNLIIGGQSGSDAVLQNCRRGHDVEDVVKACKLSIQHGFRPNVDFLLGLPGETEQDMQHTVKLAEKLVALGAKIHMHSFMPLPGTPYRGVQPVPISGDATNAFNRLSSTGKAYGQWKSQIDAAKHLSHLQSDADLVGES